MTSDPKERLTSLKSSEINIFPQIIKFLYRYDGVSFSQLITELEISIRRLKPALRTLERHNDNFAG